MDKVKEAIQEIRTTNRLDDKLLKCKGVIGVDVDYKQVKGQKTDTLSITVYVKKKLVKEELSADEAVPEMIHGIPTDVLEWSECMAFTSILRTDAKRWYVKISFLPLTLKRQHVCIIYPCLKKLD